MEKQGNTWEYAVIGVNRGDGKVKALSGNLEDVLKQVYIKAENHDTIHLGRVDNEVCTTSKARNTDLDKIVCVKLSGVSEEEVKEALSKLDLPNLNVVAEGKLIKN